MSTKKHRPCSLPHFQNIQRRSATGIEVTEPSEMRRYFFGPSVTCFRTKTIRTKRK